MDEAVYTQLHYAIQMVESIGISQTERVGYTQLLQEALTRRDLMGYLKYILTSPHSTSVQFMALKLLEDWIFKWWNSFSGDEQVQPHAHMHASRPLHLSSDLFF
jgi:hypothetical protein